MEEKDEREQEEKPDFSKGTVIAILLLVIFFIVYIVESMKVMGFEPTATVAGFFAFATGELWALSKITRAKIDKEKGGETLEGIYRYWPWRKR